MECKEENHQYCEIFFTKINEMINKYMKEEDQLHVPTVFNPYHLKDDKHGGNKIGMAAVFGKVFVDTRTSSCEYHLEQSVKKHKKHVCQSDRKDYVRLCHKMKDVHSEELYESARASILKLIARQTPGDIQSLTKALEFWHKCKSRWAAAHRKSFANIPKSSLAEASQASMTAAGEKGLSLADALIADLTDSAKFDAKWEKHLCGERNLGTGPSGSTLIDREEERQFQRVNDAAEMYKDMEEEEEEVGYSEDAVDLMLDVSRCHRPDKVVIGQKRPSYQCYDSSDVSSENESDPPAHSVPRLSQSRFRSSDSKFFQQILKTVEKKHGRVIVDQIDICNDMMKVKIKTPNKTLEVTISRELRCPCRKQQKATRRLTCWHIVWVLVNVFNVDSTDNILAQVDIGKEALKDLRNKTPSSIPDELRIMANTSPRKYHPSLQSHSSFGKQQEWYLCRKVRGRPSRCSGCITPKVILIGDLHLSVKGLLFLEEKRRVIETNFCIKNRCVREIRSRYNNIRPLSELKVKMSTDLSNVTLMEKKLLADEQFIVEGIATTSF